MFKEIKKKNIINKKQGFTLLETIFAIFILIVAITGPVAFGQSGLRAAFLARDQVIAFSLAQDAIETIKNIRDQNLLNGSGWLDGLEGGGNLCVTDVSGAPTFDGCTIDTASNISSPIITSCTGTCNPLRLILDSGGAGTTDDTYKFVTSGGTPTRFTRTIKIIETAVDQEAEIIVEVEWDTNQFITNKKITVQENIFNWAANL